MKKQFCKDCKQDTLWSRGIALINSWLVHRDFIGDYAGSLDEALDKGIDVTGQTISRTGPPNIITCDKCTECGRSAA